MALLWAEPFDIYGDDEGNMLDGLWAEIAGSVADAPSLSTTQKRTGTHSLLVPAHGSGLATNIARRVLGGAKTKAAVGGAYYLDSLPNTNNLLLYNEFRDAANARQVSFYVQSTGVIAARTAAGELEDTGTPALVSDAWNHIETMAQINNSTGAVEVRVNEVTVLNLTGVDTQSTSNAETSQIAFGKTAVDGSGAVSASWYVDDLFAWDDTTVGTNDIVDFVGDKKVFVLTTNADTAEADFSKSTGVTGYTLIDELTPDDADYIFSAVDGHVSEFGLSDLPGNAAEVIAVIPIPRLLKTDAGTVTHAADLVTNGDATAATAIPATTEATYWPFVHTKNPDTGVPWTPAELNGSLLRITRAVP